VFVRSRATPLNDSIDRQKFRRKIPRHAAGQKLVPKFTTGLEVWPIVTGKVTSAEQIAARDKCSMTISLVFLTHLISSGPPSKVDCPAALALPAYAMPRPSGRVSTGCSV